MWTQKRSGMLLLGVAFLITITVFIFFWRRSPEPVVDPTFSVLRLVQDMRKSRLTMPPCQANVEYRHRIFAAAAALPIPNTPGHVADSGDSDGEANWCYKAGKVYLNIAQHPAKALRGASKYEYQSSMTYAFDGKTVHQLERWYDQNGDSGRSTGYIRTPQSAMTNNVFHERAVFDPRNYAYMSDTQLMEKQILDKDNPVHYLQTEYVYGSRCARLATRVGLIKIALWIDLDHSFIMRKVDAQLNAKGKWQPFYTMDVTDVAGDKRLWLPAHIKMRWYNPSAQPLAEDEIRVSDLQINPTLPDSVFAMAFPKETKIYTKPLPAIY